MTNVNVWSPDGQWIVFDTRSDADGTLFDGRNIKIVHVESGEVRTVYTAQNGAHCGVATFHPRENKVVFILGPEHPTPDWEYGPAHRQGVVVDIDNPGAAINLDARDLTPPFTPGALRGGSHVHVFRADGQAVSFTYNDAVLPPDRDQRNIGVCVPGEVTVPKTHARNHDGAYFTVLATRTVSDPAPGSDEIHRAYEEGWVGNRQMLAFQGEVVTARGETIYEVFVAELPDRWEVPADDGPLAGTADQRPLPPRGTVQRRLTFTADRKYPGLQKPRHWLRSAPDGSRIAFLLRDDAGIVQLWTVSPDDNKPPRQLTRNPWPIASAFTWSANGKWVAYVADNSVFVAAAETGVACRLTPRTSDADAPLALACVFSPDSRHIAYLRRRSNPGGQLRSNQIFLVPVP